MGILKFFSRVSKGSEPQVDPAFLAQLKGESGTPYVLIGEEIKPGTTRILKSGVTVSVDKNGKVILSQN